MTEEQNRALEEKARDIKKLPFVYDAWVDDDCLHEGFVSIQIEFEGE